MAAIFLLIGCTILWHCLYLEQIKIIMMLRCLKLIIICFALVMTNCQDANISEEKVETQAEIDARTISQKDVEAIKYIDYGLSPDSQKAVVDWQKYNDLHAQVDFLKKADLSYFESDREILKTFTSEFRIEMPKALRTKAILARITAMDTKLQKLNSLLLLSTSNKQESSMVLKSS